MTGTIKYGISLPKGLKTQEAPRQTCTMDHCVISAQFVVTYKWMLL